MTKKEALIKTIYNLENDVYEYNWQNTDKCNCGVLAKTILGGKNPTECGLFDHKEAKGVGTFSMKAYCLTTGEPLSVVFKSLKDAGFTYEELCNLEFLSDRKIADRCGIKVSSFQPEQEASHGQFFVKGYLISYLKAWVSILQEEETRTQPVQTPAIEAPAVTPKVVTKTVYVAVPQSITSQTKELILS